MEKKILQFDNIENIEDTDNEKVEDSIWKFGVVLSFDLKTKKLKKYYSKKSPSGAYGKIKKYLLKNGFISLKDSDYLNESINQITAGDIIEEFCEDNKWFPLCVIKLNISPNVERLDTSNEIKLLIDEDFKLQKEKE